MSNQDNYRGITLQPVLSKLFEKCLMVRLNHWSRCNNIISEMQGTNQLKCSCLETSFIVRETISYNVHKGGKIFVALLDARKAFDTVWQDGLFYKLYNYGINGKAWRILRKMFEDFKCYVRVGNCISESFLANQGIHQGSVCSCFYFNYITIIQSKNETSVT